MQIAHVVRQYYPSVGGFEEVVRNLCKHQSEAGHTPYVITLNRYFKDLDNTLPASEIIDGIQVIRIPFVGSTRYPIALSVLKHIKQADIVHVHAIDFFYDFLALTKWWHRKKLVATTHGGFFHTGYASTFKKVFFKTVTRFSGLFYHKVIASSENDGEIFKQIIPEKKLTVIENGVDIEKLHVDNKSEFPPTLLYFGRWSENKGIFDAIDLFNQLKKADSRRCWKFIIAGRPYDINRQEILAYIDRHHLSDQIEVIENPTTAELKLLTLKATYFISMSKFEGFGIAPIEAMSAELYPILSSIPPFKKLVKRTKTGMIIGDYTDDYSIKLLRDHYRGKKYLNSKPSVNLSVYDWESVNEKYMLMYK